MTYTWTPTALIGYPQYEGQTDVITTAFYTVLADDGAGHTASIQGIQATPLDPAAPFIPYPSLTPEIVVGWIQSNLGPDGVANIEANLAAQIEAQINPPVSPMAFPLPWAPSEPQVAPEVAVTLTPSSDSLTESPVVIEPPAPDTSEPVN